MIIRNLTTILLCVLLLSMSSCEKNNCQTYLQGTWHVTQHPGEISFNIDSVRFYKGDSLYEKYSTPGSSAMDTNVTCGSYFVSNGCDEIDFIGNMQWDKPSQSSMKFKLLQITPNSIDMQSTSAVSTCDSCVVSLRR